MVIIGGGPAGSGTVLTLCKNCLDTSCLILDDVDPSSFKVMGFKVTSFVEITSFEFILVNRFHPNLIDFSGTFISGARRTGGLIFLFGVTSTSEIYGDCRMYTTSTHLT